MQTYTVLYQHCYFFVLCCKIKAQKKRKTVANFFGWKNIFYGLFFLKLFTFWYAKYKGKFRSWINFCICLMFAWNGSKLLTNIYLRDQCDLFTLFHRLWGVLDSLLSLLLFFGNSFVYHALTNVDRICRLTYQINEHVHA